MCFSWTHANGFTPIWDCNTKEDQKHDTAIRSGGMTLKQLSQFGGVTVFKMHGEVCKESQFDPNVKVHLNHKGDQQPMPGKDCTWGHYCMKHRLDPIIARSVLEVLKNGQRSCLFKAISRAWSLQDRPWDERVDMNVLFAWTLDDEYLPLSVHLRSCMPKLQDIYANEFDEYGQCVCVGTTKVIILIARVCEYFCSINDDPEVNRRVVCWNCVNIIRLTSGSAEEIRDSKFQKCYACKVARYCSSDCQQTHWSTHKSDCARLRSSHRGDLTT